jgi:hypothetical protein
MKSKFKIMDLLREGFKLNTLKKLDGKQISVLHKKLVNEQDTTSDKTEKIKNDLAMANQSAQQLSNELGEESGHGWGSSDQHFFNQSIHKQLGEPEKMPSPFSRELEDAVEDAVDFYWDDWEEYQTDRDGLIVHGKRAYLRSYFTDNFNMLVKMFEPADELHDDDNELLEDKDADNSLEKESGYNPYDGNSVGNDDGPANYGVNPKAGGDGMGIAEEKGKKKKKKSKKVDDTIIRPVMTTLGMFEEDSEYAICMDSIQGKYGPKKTWKNNAEKKFDACVSSVGKQIKERKENIRKIEESIVSLIKDVNKPSMTKKDLMDIIEQGPGTKEAPVKTPTRTKPKRKNPYQPKHKPAPKAKVEDKDLPDFLKFDNLNISFKDEEKN